MSAGIQKQLADALRAIIEARREPGSLEFSGAVMEGLRALSVHELAKHTAGPWERRGNMVFGEDKGPGTAPLIAECSSVERAQQIVDCVNAMEEGVALLRELVDIEGPQPGHVMWARKVKAFLASIGGAA